MRIQTFLIVLTVAAACLGTARAHAVEGCAMADGLNGTGASTGWFLSSDVTASLAWHWGSTSSRSARSKGVNGVDLTGRARSVWIIAEQTDIQMYVYAPHTQSIPNKPSGAPSIGGDGLNFTGGVYAYRCAKGKTCMWNANSVMSNGSVICQREFYQNEAVDIQAPLMTSPFIKRDGKVSLSIGGEVQKAISDGLLPEADKLSDVHSYAVWEPGLGYCKHAEATGSLHPLCFTSANMQDDLLRVHYDARFDPDAENTKSCGGTIGLVAVLFPIGILEYEAITQVCEKIAGEYRIVIDLWFRPSNRDSSHDTPFDFDNIQQVVTVKPYSGNQADTVKNKLVKHLNDSKPAGLIRDALLTKIGAEACKLNLPDITMTAKCVTSHWALAGSRLFQINDPGRIQFSYHMAPGLSPDRNGVWPWAYVGPTGLSSGPEVGRTAILDIHLGRGATE